MPLSIIAGDLLPLSTVQSKRFRNMLNKADSKYQIPSRKHLTKDLLPLKITKIQEQRIAQFKQVDKVRVKLGRMVRDELSDVGESDGLSPVCNDSQYEYVNDTFLVSLIHCS